MSTQEHNETTQATLLQYVELDVRIQALKLQLKQHTADFKARGTVIHQFLHKHPGNTCRVTETHTVQLKEKTKTSGLNPPLIGEGYLDFQRAHGRPDVTTDERDAFLLALKTIRQQKKEVVQNVHIVVNH